MNKLPLPSNETERLEALRRYDILDSRPEAAFDRITNLAARLFTVPIALVSFIDHDRQWFKSRYGLAINQTSREVAFCANAILAKDVLVVPDASEDPRFANNPLVTEPPNIRFYAGAPLQSPDGFCLGTLCIIDTVRRELSQDQIATLADLAAIVTDELELRLAVTKNREIRAALSKIEQELQNTKKKLEIRVAERTSQLSQANAALRHHARRLKVLHELNRAITANLRLTDVYDAFARHATRLLPYDHLSVTLVEGDAMRVSYVAGENGNETVPVLGTSLPRKTSAVGWVIDRRQPLLRHDIAEDKRFAEDKYLVAEGITSSMIIPLQIKGQVIGTWNIGHQGVGAYGPDDLEIAQSMASQLAIAIENARLYEQARQEIKERRQAEETLRKSESRYRTLLETIPDLMFR